MARFATHRRRRPRAWITSCVSAAITAAAIATTSAAEPPSSTPPPAAEPAVPALFAARPELAEMKEADRLLAEAYEKKDAAKADELHARGVEIVRRLYDLAKVQQPVDKPAVSMTVNGLYLRYSTWGAFRKSVGNFSGEEKVWSDLDVLLTAEYGKWYWRAVDARLAGRVADYCSRAGAFDVLRLLSTTTYVVRANALQGEGKYREAIEQAEQGIQSFQGLVGVESAEYFRAFRTLGDLYLQQGRFAEAEANFERCLTLAEPLFGTRHPEYAYTENRFGLLRFQQARFADALPHYERARAIFEATSGRKTTDYAAVLNAVGSCYNNLEQFPQAEAALKQSIALFREVSGEKNVQCATALGNLGYLYGLQARYAEAEPLFVRGLEIYEELHGKQHPETLNFAATLGSQLLAVGRYAQAEALFRRVAEGRKELLGDRHPAYAAALTRLGFLHRAKGAYVEAEPFFEQAREITAASFGHESLAYALCLSNIGSLNWSQGTYAAALTTFHEAAEIIRRVNGEDTYFAHTLGLIAATLNMQGKFLEAESATGRALKIIEAKYGPRHPLVSETLGIAATTARGLADNAEAERLSRRVVDIELAVYGKEHVAYARAVVQLADIVARRRDFPQAEALYQSALAAYRAAVGEEHPDYAAPLAGLAAVYQEQDRLEETEQLLLQAYELQRRRLGETHPQSIATLSSLGTLRFLQGRGDEARKHFERAYELARAALGDGSETAAQYLNLLARVEHAAGNFAAAEPHCRAALAATQAWIERTMEAQSERRQLALAASQAWYLDTYLSIAIDSGRFAEDAYRNALRRKGITWMQQRRLRSVADDPQAAPLFAELQTTASKLAQQAMTEPTPEQRETWRREVNDLARKKEQLEQQLAENCEAYRRSKQSVTFEELTACLPDDAVLVDFVEYAHYVAPGVGGVAPLSQRRFAAFVVRKRRPVELISLGPADAAIAAIDRWREAYGIGPDGVAAGRQLREQLWQPLESRLEGAKFVIVSPDGALGRLPLAALPGRKADDYLIEDWALTTVPVPQALPSLLKDDADAMPAPSGNLLLVGGIDYDAVPGAPLLAESPKKQFGRRPTRGAEWKGFEPLAGTVGEIAVIEKTYRDLFGNEGITTLEKAAALEERFTAEAPKHLYLHVATHGFFAPPSLRTAITAAPLLTASEPSLEPGEARSTVAAVPQLVGLHPGLLSGLALAGANRPPADDRADGILTAEEVQTLDLRRVQLATLSACETGLGEVAGGEGLLGLQRSFQVAGVRTTVSSLWKVDDVQTRALMERFYRNLWEKDLTKLEALREAQLWMLREGPRRDVRLRPADVQAVEELKKSPPFYWAAFLLSGDWR